MSRLFDKLPFELREHIYGYALQSNRLVWNHPQPHTHDFLDCNPDRQCDSDEINGSDSKVESTGPVAQASLAFAMLRTCKRMLREALPIFYELNEVHIGYVHLCATFSKPNGGYCGKYLLEHLIRNQEGVRCDISSTDDWPQCGTSTLVTNSLKMPSVVMKNFTVDLDRYPGGWVAVREQLQNAKLSYKFTAVGVCKVNFPSASKAVVHLAFDQLADHWSRYATAVVEYFKHLGDTTADEPLGLRLTYSETQVEGRFRYSFRQWYNCIRFEDLGLNPTRSVGLEHAAGIPEARRKFERKYGVRMPWVPPEQTAEVQEQLTVAFGGV